MTGERLPQPMSPTPGPFIGQRIPGPYSGQTSVVRRVSGPGTVDVEVTEGPGAGRWYRVSGLAFTFPQPSKTGGAS